MAEYKTSLRLDLKNSKHLEVNELIQNRDRAKGATITDYVVACILLAEKGTSISYKDELKNIVKDALVEHEKEKESKSFL
jgi:hypothetical protein